MSQLPSASETEAAFKKIGQALKKMESEVNLQTPANREYEIVRESAACGRYKLFGFLCGLACGVAGLIIWFVVNGVPA